MFGKIRMLTFVLTLDAPPGLLCLSCPKDLGREGVGGAGGAACGPGMFGLEPGHLEPSSARLAVFSSQVFPSQKWREENRAGLVYVSDFNYRSVWVPFQNSISLACRIARQGASAAAVTKRPQCVVFSKMEVFLSHSSPDRTHTDLSG